MKEFVYGTDEQYKTLRESLEDHQCHVYKNCVLTSCCDKEKARIGFEKEAETYALLIDKGIACTGSAPGAFSGMAVLRNAEISRFQRYEGVYKGLEMPVLN